MIFYNIFGKIIFSSVSHFSLLFKLYLIYFKYFLWYFLLHLPQLRFVGPGSHGLASRPSVVSPGSQVLVINMPCSFHFFRQINIAHKFYLDSGDYITFLLLFIKTSLNTYCYTVYSLKFSINLTFKSYFTLFSYIPYLLHYKSVKPINNRRNWFRTGEWGNSPFTLESDEKVLETWNLARKLKNTICFRKWTYRCLCQ